MIKVSQYNHSLNLLQKVLHENSEKDLKMFIQHIKDLLAGVNNA